MERNERKQQLADVADEQETQAPTRQRRAATPQSRQRRPRPNSSPTDSGADPFDPSTSVPSSASLASMLDTMPQTPAMSSNSSSSTAQPSNLNGSSSRALARRPGASLPTQTAQPGSRLPARTTEKILSESGVTILPAKRPTQVSRALERITTPAPSPRRTPWISTRAVIAFTLVITILVVALGLNTRQGSPQTVISTPPPSGSGPFTASVNSVLIQAPAPTASPAPTNNNNGGTSNYASLLQPCQQKYQFIPNITQWSVPPGCYSYIYIPNPANYVSRPGFGWCNWWVRVTHPNHPDITENTAYPRSLVPAVGAPIFFDGGEQGADPSGHWAVTVAISPDHYWVLISEMNFAWRGGGFGRIDYRYIHVSPHVHFVYIFS